MPFGASWRILCVQYFFYTAHNASQESRPVPWAGANAPFWRRRLAARWSAPRWAGVFLDEMRFGAGITLVLVIACSGGGSSPKASSTQVPTHTPTAAASPPAVVDIPPPGSQRIEGGCGKTQIYKGGVLPDWANVNAPKFLPHVVATPGIAVGYLFSYPLTAGLNADTKILWYVGTPRAGSPLVAEGHPLGARGPIARFNKAADSGPGEIYPTGPTVPSPGCWHFMLSWQDAAQRADVDLLFR